MSATFTPGGTRFYFSAFTPGGGGGGTTQFRAHITNISDSYNPQWNQYMDMGRATPKVMYAQFARTITVDFLTVVLAKDEINTWVNALNSVSDMTKPVYKSGLGYNGVFTKIVIGTLINEIGYISNCTWQIDNETPWVYDKPIVINCSVTLEVIGDKKPNYLKSGGLGNKKFGPGKDKGPGMSVPLV